MFIPNTYFATSATALGSISGVNVNNRYTCLKSFVFDKLLKLTKSPGVESLSLFPGKFDPFPDVRQFCIRAGEDALASHDAS